MSLSHILSLLVGAGVSGDSLVTIFKEIETVAQRRDVTPRDAAVALTGAERSRIYREKRRQKRDAAVTNASQPSSRLGTIGVTSKIVNKSLEKRKKESSESESARRETVTVKPVTPSRSVTRFAEFRAAYPQRDGSNPWKPAEAAYNRAIAMGHPEEAIIAGTRRYAAWCNVRGKTKTDKVAQATTFLNQIRFEESYDATVTPIQSKVSAVADRFRARLAQNQNGANGGPPEAGIDAGFPHLIDGDLQASS